MCIHPLSSNVGVTRNGNPYQKSRAGKRFGEALGTSFVLCNAIKLHRSGELAKIGNKAVEKLVALGPKFVAKNPKLIKAGFLGTAILLATAMAAGIGKLAGHCVDKIVELKRKKAADKAAEV